MKARPRCLLDWPIKNIYCLLTGAAKKAVTGTQPYLLTANYTGWYLTHDHDSEWRLNYFTEDIGLNSLYFYFHVMSPMWMSSEKYHLVQDYRGELYYYVHKQIMARYNMERLSHDLGELEYIDWDKPIATGYYPSMIHSTGLPYPQRPTWSDVPMHKYKYLEVSTKICSFTLFLRIDDEYLRMCENL